MGECSWGWGDVLKELGGQHGQWVAKGGPSGEEDGRGWRRVVPEGVGRVKAGWDWV